MLDLSRRSEANRRDGMGGAWAIVICAATGIVCWLIVWAVLVMAVAAT